MMTGGLRLSSTARALLVIGVLPNVLVGLMAAPHGSRALVNLEYLVLAALDRFVSRTMLTILLGVTLLVDVLFSFAPAFNFGPGEILAAVEQLRHFRGRAIVFAAGIIAGIAAIAVLLVRLRGTARADDGAAGGLPGVAQRFQLAAMSGIVAGVVLLADVANGSNLVGWRAATAVPFDVATTVFAGQYARGIGQTPESGQPVAAATDALRRDLAAAGESSWRAPSKIVLIVVESMGLPRGADLEAVFAPLTSDALALRYQIRTGTVPFAGATTSGEFRELCGIRMSHVSVVPGDLPNCLPRQLAARGYASVALHAYNGSLFERRDWYPRVGFDRMVFAEELEQGRKLETCGLMFHGPCDSGVLTLIRDELVRQPDRRDFVYWLTLSSHFPLDPRTDRSPAACDSLGAPGRTREVCALWTAVWPVLEGIAALASDTTVPPAWYIVVGDHAPPQVLSDGRTHPAYPPSDGAANRFLEDRLPFAPNEVPFIELRPMNVGRSVERAGVSR